MTPELLVRGDSVGMTVSSLAERADLSYSVCIFLLPEYRSPSLPDIAYTKGVMSTALSTLQ
jgi:hypothetical protein